MRAIAYQSNIDDQIYASVYVPSGSSKLKTLNRRLEKYLKKIYKRKMEVKWEYDKITHWAITRPLGSIFYAKRIREWLIKES